MMRHSFVFTTNPEADVDAEDILAIRAFTLRGAIRKAGKVDSALEFVPIERWGTCFTCGMQTIFVTPCECEHHGICASCGTPAWKNRMLWLRHKRQEARHLRKVIPAVTT